MAPALAEQTDIYFLAESPGEDDAKPIAGPAGKLLRSCIEDASNCSFDTVCNCHPGGRTPTWNEVECCRPRRNQFIAKAKPYLIVGLGDVALRAMLDSGDMQGMRGRVFAVNVGGHDCWFMPTYSPNDIIKWAYDKKDPIRGKFGHCFKMDIKRAFKLARNLPPAHVDTEAEATAGVQCFDGSGADHLGAVLGLLSEARKAHIKAVDIETQGLRPYAADAAILTCAISFGDTNFSFAIDHPKAGWQNARGAILTSLGQLLRDDTIKVAHNAPFEIEWFIKFFGKGVVNHHAWECTQMQAHFLDERRGKGNADDRRASYQALDFLCKQYFGIAYKKLFKLNKKNMAGEDLGRTLLYNGVDTKYTLRLYYKQWALLKQDKLLGAYKEARPRQPVVALMQHIGMPIDQQENKKAKEKLEAEIKEMRGKIADLKVVKAFARDNGEFNPESGPQVVKIFKDYLKRKEVIADDSKTGFSTNKNVLSTIDHPLAGLLLELRNRAKLFSTYIAPFTMGSGLCVWPDGLVHTSFNTTFAETGRTSSDEPNQQNWPKRKDAWVRRQVVPPKGHVILAFDYGQLEGCTSAICSGDKVLIKALWEDYDIHKEWALKTAKAIPEILTGDINDPKYLKAFRSLIKNKLVFPSIFGAKEESVAGYLNAPVDKTSKLMKEFWRTFHGLAEWQDQLMKGYYETGWVESPTGRRHRYPLTRNQAINFPIQSFACDIVCSAMNVLSQHAAATNTWHLHPVLNIHDDLTFLVPDDDEVIEGAIEAITVAMLSPPYKCINVPLSVECSIGTNWYQMTDVQKFWSHKDV